jgi:2-polyprenyl-6-methoxyphenol hydroxylase-like FAD-dependent oxidoreductase
LLIEATSRGWWYSFPLPSEKLLVAFVTDPRIEKLSENRRESFWHAMLNEAPHTKTRCGISFQELGVASVESASLDPMSGDAWIAIGDSAITFDPLSSHGLTSAIEQATKAAEILSQHADQSALSAFDSERIGLFEKYQAQRLHFYRSVRRFSGQAFWRERVVHCEFTTTAQVRGMSESFSRQVPIDLDPKPGTVSQSRRGGD